MAGLVASARARELGADVRVLEKGPRAGGSMLLSSGVVWRYRSLDVFQQEPLPADSPLWGLPNVIITPHVGGLTPRYGERLAAILAHNLRAYRGQGEWRNRVS